MRHIIAAAYKDALHGLRQDMAHRMMGHATHPDEEDEEQNEMGDTPEGMHPQEKADEAEGELGLHHPQESPMEDRFTDEEKRERMYGQKGQAPKRSGVAVMIGMSKPMGKGKGRR